MFSCRYWLILLFFLVNSFFAQGQSGDASHRLQSFVRRAEDFNRYYPQEKVYLHLDNTGYFLGERIWFKAYVVTAPFCWLTTLSETLYVELLAPEGYVIETKKLPVVNGQCHGDFYLDSANYSGYYEIRAYTRWMLNFGESTGPVMADAVVPGIYSRVFPVFDRPSVGGDYTKQYLRPRSREILSPNKSMSPLFVHFYPEGGQLVRGVPSVIAFQVLDEQGRYMSLKGKVVDERDKYVTSLRTVHRGMGNFLLTPHGHHYFVELEVGDKTFRYPLPEVAREGFVLHVTNQLESGIRIEVNGSDGMVSDTLGLLLMNGGQPYAFENIFFKGGKSSELELLRDSLPTGVYQILLLDRSGRPLCERKVFIRGKGISYFEIFPENLQRSYEPYKKIGLDFQLYQNGHPLQERHTFSLSVRDSMSEVQTWNTGDIGTYLLLSSEVRGYIPDVDYYFAEDTPARQEHLDLLLQVQGWTRYSWEKMCGLTKMIFRHPQEQGITLQGRLLSDRDGFLYYNKLMNGAKIRWQMYNDSLGLYGNLITDSVGRYRLVFDNLYGSWHINLHSDDRRLEQEYIPYGSHPWARLSLRAQICVDRMFSPHAKEYSYYECNRPDLVVGDYILSHDTLIRSIGLSEAKAMGNNRGRIYHRPGVRAKIADLIEEYLDINFEEWALDGECLTKYLIKKMKFSGGSYCLVRDSVLMKSADFINFGEEIILATMPPRPRFYYYSLDWYRGWTGQLDSIEIILDYAYRDSLRQKGGGCDYMDCDRDESREVPDYVFRFRTTYPYGKKLKLFSRTRDFIFDGYASVEEFCSPDYSQHILPSAGDYRRTLYWNPDVRTDSLGRASVEFYNNSSCRKLKVSAETVLPDGRIGACFLAH